MMGKYLISAIERRWAVGIARDKGLKANQWVYGVFPPAPPPRPAGFAG
jgi:hypothetical protein